MVNPLELEVSDLGSDARSDLEACHTFHYKIPLTWLQAILKACEWFEFRSAGDTPQFILMVSRVNWGAFDISAADFQERLENVLGFQDSV